MTEPWTASFPPTWKLPQEPEFEMGGGGLYSTVSDYLCFTRMIMNNGALDGTRVLAPQTVTIMGANAMGDLTCRALKTSAPASSNDVDFIDGMRRGLSFLINPQPLPTGRAAGSLAWAGLANSYFRIDRVKQVTGVDATQVLPFFDAKVAQLFHDFETAVYQLR
jgi:CubicO group peptidase (beta-lactamase class C family)